MNNAVLESLGLTAEEVREAFGVPEPSELTQEEDKNYLFAGDQRRMRRRLKQYHGFIISRYFEGYSPKIIAGFLGVSEEAVRSRLRKANLFRNQGKPGRPKRISPSKSCSSDSRLSSNRVVPTSTACLTLSLS